MSCPEDHGIVEVQCALCHSSLTAEWRAQAKAEEREACLEALRKMIEDYDTGCGFKDQALIDRMQACASALALAVVELKARGGKP